MVPVKKIVNVMENNIIVTNCCSEKVVCEEILANQKLKYRLIESQQSINGEDVLCYGIEIECSLFGETEKSKISDITTKLELAKELFYILCDNLVTPTCLKDIVEDFITEKYS